jgi:protein CpxP
MKKLVIILAALAITTGAATAQTTPAKAERHGKERHDKKTPEQKAEYGAKKMAEKLSLSAQQTEQVRQLFLARQQEKQALHAQAAPADKAKAHADRKASRERYEAQLKQILSADQYTKYAQLRAERMEKHKGGRKGKSYKG